MPKLKWKRKKTDEGDLIWTSTRYRGPVIKKERWADIMVHRPYGVIWDGRSIVATKTLRGAKQLCQTITNAIEEAEK